MIYFIQESKEQYIKIGFSEDPYLRIQHLITASPVKTEYHMLLVIPGGRRMETDLHRKFHDFHSQGEWFIPHASILEFVKSKTQEEMEFCRICGIMYLTSPDKEGIQNHCNIHKKIKKGIYPYRVRETMKNVAWQVLATNKAYAEFSSEIDKDDYKRLIVYSWWARKRETVDNLDSYFDDYILDYMEYLDARFSGDKILLKNVNKRIVEHWGKDKY
jgi:hypothetical protein